MTGILTKLINLLAVLIEMVIADKFNFSEVISETENYGTKL